MKNSFQIKAAATLKAAHGYSASVVRLRNTSAVSIDYSVRGGSAVELASGASAVVDVAALTSEISVRRTDLSATPANVILEFGLTADEAYEQSTLAAAAAVAVHDLGYPLAQVRNRLRPAFAFSTSLLICTDSTGVGHTNWPYKAAVKLAAEAPEFSVRYRPFGSLTDGQAQSWGAWEYLYEASGSRPFIRFTGATPAAAGNHPYYPPTGPLGGDGWRLDIELRPNTLDAGVDYRVVARTDDAGTAYQFIVLISGNRIKFLFNDGTTTGLPLNATSGATLDGVVSAGERSTLRIVYTGSADKIFRFYAAAGSKVGAVNSVFTKLGADVAVTTAPGATTDFGWRLGGMSTYPDFDGDIYDVEFAQLGACAKYTAVTASAVANTVYLPGIVAAADGMLLVFESGTGFTGLTTGNGYYIRDYNPTARTCKLSASIIGGEIDISVNGTAGVFVLHDYSVKLPSGIGKWRELAQHATPPANWTYMGGPELDIWCGAHGGYSISTFVTAGSFPGISGYWSNRFCDAVLYGALHNWATQALDPAGLAIRTLVTNFHNYAIAAMPEASVVHFSEMPVSTVKDVWTRQYTQRKMSWGEECARRLGEQVVSSYFHLQSTLTQAEIDAGTDASGIHQLPDSAMTDRMAALVAKMLTPA